MDPALRLRHTHSFVVFGVKDSFLSLFLHVIYKFAGKKYLLQWYTECMTYWHDDHIFMAEITKINQSS